MFLNSIKLSHVVSPQLVPYWEKTFDIDLSAPQIGVVNVTDVSFLPSPLTPIDPQLCFPEKLALLCSAKAELSPSQKNQTCPV